MRQDSEEIRFPGPERYPRWLVPLAVACGLPLFAYFAYFGNSLRGFAASLSAGVIVVTVVTLWNFRKYYIFWLVIIIAVISHVLLVYETSGSNTHFPGIVFTPIFIIDFLFWQFLSVWSIRLFRS